VSDVSNDVRLGHNTDHNFVSVAHDHKAYMRVGQKLCRFTNGGIRLNRTQTLSRCG